MDSSNQGATGFKPIRGVYTTSAVKTIVPTNGQTRGFVIRNLDATDTLYVGPDSTVTPDTGFPILPGESYSCPFACPIWMVGAVGGNFAAAELFD